MALFGDDAREWAGRVRGTVNLEELDIRNMNHRIGVDDLLWMHAKCPNLNAFMTFAREVILPHMPC